MGFVSRHLEWISLFVTSYGALLPVLMWYEEGKSTAVLYYSVPLVLFFFVFLAVAIRTRRPVIDDVARNMLALAVKPEKESWPMCCGLTTTHACGRAVAAMAAKDLCWSLRVLQEKTHTTAMNVGIEKVYSIGNLDEHLTRLEQLMNLYHGLGWVRSCCIHLPGGRDVLSRLDGVFSDINQNAIAPALKLRQQLRGVMPEEMKQDFLRQVGATLRPQAHARSKALQDLAAQTTLDQMLRILDARRSDAAASPVAAEILARIVEHAVRPVLEHEVFPALDRAQRVFPELERDALGLAAEMGRDWHDDVHKTWADRACKPKPEDPPAVPVVPKEVVRN